MGWRWSRRWKVKVMVVGQGLGLGLDWVEGGVWLLGTALFLGVWVALAVEWA